ncbi:MAG TPA: YitT family protein, partial [Saprospiraceae bacterium]|nr:YitT family protein [Saprospiraceae bacterium]
MPIIFNSIHGMQIQDKVNWDTILSKKSLIFTSLGIVLAVIALKGFMVPNNFLDGGVTGISILFRVLFGVDISLFLIILNLPFIYVGYKKIGKTFAIQTLIAVLLMSFLMKVLPVPLVTEDQVLIAVFGGFLIGLGIGFVIKGGAVIDGLEVIAEYTTKNYGLSSG